MVMINGGRLLLAIAAFALMACSSGVASKIKELNDVSDLSEVSSQPLSYSGKIFQGYVYLYVGEGYYGLFPTSVTDEAQVDSFTVHYLIGENGPSLDALKKFKSGQRLLVRGRLMPDRACFTGDTCAPWPHPVSIDDLKI